MLLTACSTSVLAIPPAPQAGSGGIAIAPTPVEAAPITPQVVLVIMENHGADQIIGSKEAPYLNSLVADGGLAKNYAAIRHPSLPNYLALTGGSTFGIDSNCTSCHVKGDSLADQLELAGRSWKAYEESIPRPCYLGGYANAYAKKHSPFLYYDTLTDDRARCKRHVVGFDELSRDIARDALSDFSLIVPNELHDMHSASVQTGDRFLKSFLRDLIATSSFQQRGVLLVTFDEASGNPNEVPLIVVGPFTPPGMTSDHRFDHYSTLRSIEELFGLPLLRHAGRSTTRSMVPELIPLFGST